MDQGYWCCIERGRDDGAYSQKTKNGCIEHGMGPCLAWVGSFVRVRINRGRAGVLRNTRPKKKAPRFLV